MVSNNKTKLGGTHDREKGGLARGDCPGHQATDLERTKERLDELIVKGVLDEETYKAKSETVRNEIALKKIELYEIKTGLDDVQPCISFCKYFLSNTANLWEMADLDLRRLFQSLIFPEKVYCDDESFRTPATAILFSRLEGKPEEMSHLAALNKQSY